MQNIDEWTKQLTRAYKEELEEAIVIEQRSELEKYGKILQSAILRVWDNYMNSYTPVVYKRTGRTRQGIILDKNVKVGANGKLEIAVQFLDSYMDRYETITGEKRNTFLAIDEGWVIDTDKPYNYGYASGQDLTGQIRDTIESLLPDYIHFEFVGVGNII